MIDFVGDPVVNTPMIFLLPGREYAYSMFLEQAPEAQSRGLCNLSRTMSVEIFGEETVTLLYFISLFLQT
jgi:hypothetical protein